MSGTDQATVYQNTSGLELTVDADIDGVSTRSVIKPGASSALGQCPPSAQSCLVRVYSSDSNGEETDYFVKQYDRPSVPPAGTPSSVAVDTGGAGYGPGFSETSDHLTYANTSAQTLTVVYHNRGGIDQVFSVRPGAKTELPKCDPTDSCEYSVGTGFYDPQNPDAFSLRRGISVFNGIAMYGGSGYDETDLQRTADNITYTNKQPTAVHVTFSDQFGQMLLATVPPGGTIALPKCGGPDNACDYIVESANHEPLTMMRVSNGPATDAPDPGQTTPTSGVPTPTSSPGGHKPPKSGSGSSGAVPNSDGWSVPLSQLDLCAQIAGGAQLTHSSQLANVGYACSGVSMGLAAGKGDWRSVASSVIGLGAGAVANRFAYLPSVAINVWAYTAGQAVQTDWSSIGSTTNYAVRNPGVVVQETVKATGVVLSSIWPAFLPKW